MHETQFLPQSQTGQAPDTRRHTLQRLFFYPHKSNLKLRIRYPLLVRLHYYDYYWFLLDCLTWSCAWDVSRGPSPSSHYSHNILVHIFIVMNKKKKDKKFQYFYHSSSVGGYVINYTSCGLNSVGTFNLVIRKHNEKLKIDNNTCDWGVM